MYVGKSQFFFTSDEIPTQAILVDLAIGNRPGLPASWETAVERKEQCQEAILVQGN